MTTIITKDRPDNWKTYLGDKKEIHELDYQHLCNIYWYHLILHGKKLNWVLAELQCRFNGQLGQYLPHSKYSFELEWLEKNSILKWRTNTELGMEIGEIIYFNELIGVIKRFI